MRVGHLISLVLVVACTDPANLQDDGEAQGAAVAPADGVVAASGVAGLYATHESTREADDVTALDLRVTAKPDGSKSLDYVRSRCYGTHCSLELPETDHYDVYTSSTGKTYVRFWTVTVAHDTNGTIDTAPKLADVYEIATTAGAIKLRKSYTSRWLTLGPTTESAVCNGAWVDGSCGCAAGQTFVAGAGGCIPMRGANEKNCDATGGLWTDDDATLIGSYCICGADRYVDATGSCATIDAR